MQPYKGLQPYTEKDKDNFFGRDAEKRILIDKMLTHKLTFLFAASGVGKSSLLRAAVLPELMQPGRVDREPLDVIYYTNWVDDPLVALKHFIVKDLKKKGQLTAEYELDINLPLPAFFHICTAFTSEPLVIILDQFEEFFNYQRFSTFFQPFIGELAAAVHDRQTKTVFVISMREDFALELNAFKDYIPTFLIDNFFRLEKLTLENARLAVINPVAKVGFAYEPALLDQLLIELVQEQRDRYGLEAVFDEKLPSFVQPPHLQMICMQLWDLAQDNAEKRITQAVFESKGGTKGLLKRYFLDKMDLLSSQDTRLVSAVFDLMVNEYGAKMPRSLPELGKLTQIDEQALKVTLDKLDAYRILRRQKRYGTTKDGILWYELHHDFFSEPIYAWNDKYKFQQKVRLYKWRAVKLVAGGLFLFVGYDAWVNYSSSHLRLSVKSGLSDVVEVYRGKAGSYDFFGQQGFVVETVYERRDIEADKLFIEQPVVEIEQLNTEVVGRLPLADRIVAYLANGDLDKVLGLARCAISDNDIHLSEKVILNFISFRSVETYGLLGDILQTEQNDKSREKIVEVLGQSKAPKQVVPFLIAATKDEINDIRKQATESLGELGSEKAIEPLIALLKDSDSYVQKQAAKLLGQLGSEKAIEPLIALLKDEDSDVREQAASSLGKLGSEKAIEPLIALLNDQDSSVRWRAAYSLGKLGSEKAIEPLIALLKDEYSSVKEQAARSLGELGSEKATELLIALLKDEDSYVQEQAARLLGELGSEKAIEPLFVLFKNKNLEVQNQDSDIQKQVVIFLGQLGDKRVIEPLIDLLKYKNIRKTVVRILLKLTDVEFLLAQTKNQRQSVHRSTIYILGELTHEHEKAIKPLIDLLTDKQSSIRFAAAYALSQLHNDKGKEYLLKQLHSQQLFFNERFLSKIFEGLSNFKNDINLQKSLFLLLKEKDKSFLHDRIKQYLDTYLGTLNILTFVFNKQNANVRKTLAKLLGEKDITLYKLASVLDSNTQKIVTGLKLHLLKRERDSYGNYERDKRTRLLSEMLIHFLNDKDLNVQIQAIKSLGELTVTVEELTAIGIREPLINLLKNENVDIRKQAAISLVQLNDKRRRTSSRHMWLNNSNLRGKNKIESFIFLLSDKDSNRRRQTAKLLGQLANRIAIEPLVELLEDQDSDVQKQAALSLGQLGSEKAIEPLIALLNDKNWTVRKQAAQSLSQLSAKQAIEPLIALLKDQDSSVREQAVQSLSQLGAKRAIEP
jgi:HEAT repeat protein